VARYGEKFKQRAVARLLPPESSAISAVSQEIGILVATLERWRADALSMPALELNPERESVVNAALAAGKETASAA
jgi:transposase-like protein